MLIGENDVLVTALKFWSNTNWPVNSEETISFVFLSYSRKIIQRQPTNWCNWFKNSQREREMVKSHLYLSPFVFYGFMFRNHDTQLSAAQRKSNDKFYQVITNYFMRHYHSCYHFSKWIGRTGPLNWSLSSGDANTICFYVDSSFIKKKTKRSEIHKDIRTNINANTHTHTKPKEFNSFACYSFVSELVAAGHVGVPAIIFIIHHEIFRYCCIWNTTLTLFRWELLLLLLLLFVSDILMKAKWFWSRKL